MPLQEIEDKIKETFPNKYSEVGLSIILQEIMAMEPEIRQELENFLFGRKYQNIKVQGYTLKKLTGEHNMNELAAFLTLDWIKKSPNEAISSLKKNHKYIKL
jgi:hypothetical protein